MPDKEGKLSSKEREKAQAWIREHWKNWRCPFSGDTDWKLGEHLARVNIPRDGGLGISSEYYPYLAVMCSGCGYTVFINAVVVGIMSPTKRVKENAKK